MAATKPTFKTGGNADSWCTKCKLDLAHTIIAMVDDLPVKVKCNTCDGVHKYRAPKGAEATKKKATKRAKKAAAPKKPRTTKAEREAMAHAAELLAQWTAKRDSGKADDARAYKITEGFGADEALKHKKFGVGFVTEELAYNRIKVLFEDAERTLVMNHGQTAPTA